MYVGENIFFEYLIGIVLIIEQYGFFFLYSISNKDQLQTDTKVISVLTFYLLAYASVYFFFGLAYKLRTLKVT